MSSVQSVTHLLSLYRSRASSPCITDVQSATVAERHRARQTRSPLIHEIVPQLGRLASAVPSPDSCRSHPGGELASARSGRARKFGRSGSMMSGEDHAHVGIDVSKATLDVAIEPSHEHWQVGNDERGIHQLVERLGQLRPERIVLEATGGYEL